MKRTIELLKYEIDRLVEKEQSLTKIVVDLETSLREMTGQLTDVKDYLLDYQESLDKLSGFRVATAHSILQQFPRAEETKTFMPDSDLAVSNV